VLSRFATAVLEDGEPVIYGDGEQTRDFTFVENAVQANLLACEAPGAAGRIFNVGTGRCISLNQTLELLQKLSGKKVQAKYEAAREGDIRDSQADISNAREFLGYEPSVHFEEGLQRTFEWYQAQHAKISAKQP
jgi:UDP-glucose 4-epimerase